MSTTFYFEANKDPQEIRVWVDWKGRQYDLYVLRRRDFPDGVHIQMGGKLPSINPIQLPRHPAKRALYARGYRSHQYTNDRSLHDFVFNLVPREDQVDGWQRRADYLAETHPSGPQEASRYIGYWNAVGDLGWDIFASPNGQVAIASQSTGTNRYTTRLWVSQYATESDVELAFAEEAADIAKANAHPEPWRLPTIEWEAYKMLPMYARAYINSRISAERFFGTLALRSANSQ